MTESVIEGRAEEGAIVKGPVPPRLNWICGAESLPQFELASVMASRKLPVPPSSVFVTV